MKLTVLLRLLFFWRELLEAGFPMNIINDGISAIRYDQPKMSSSLYFLRL